MLVCKFVINTKKKNFFLKNKKKKKKHLKNLFYGHLNINSLRNKREFLEPLIRNHFDVFLVSEAKLDSNFPGSEFRIPGYRLFRKEKKSTWTRFDFLCERVYSL